MQQPHHIHEYGYPFPNDFFQPIPRYELGEYVRPESKLPKSFERFHDESDQILKEQQLQGYHQ